MSVGPGLQPLHMAYSRVVRGCSSMARRLAWFLHRRLWRGRQSPGGWGHGRHVGLPPVRSQSCTAGSPNLWYFFIWHYCFCLFCYFRCDLTLLLLVILLFSLWFDIIAFGYFVIFVAIRHYCFRFFCYFRCDLTLSASSYYVHCDWTEHVVIAFSYLLLIVSDFTASSILLYVLCDGLSETAKIEVLCTFIRMFFFDKV